MQKIDEIIDELNEAAKIADQVRLDKFESDPTSAFTALGDISKVLHDNLAKLLTMAPSETIQPGHIGIAIQLVGQNVGSYAANDQGHGLQMKTRFEMYGVLEMAFQQLRVQIGKGNDINAIRQCVIMLAAMSVVGLISINNKHITTYDGKEFEE